MPVVIFPSVIFQVRMWRCTALDTIMPQTLCAEFLKIILPRRVYPASGCKFLQPAFCRRAKHSPLEHPWVQMKLQCQMARRPAVDASESSSASRVVSPYERTSRHCKDKFSKLSMCYTCLASEQVTSNIIVLHMTNKFLWHPNKIYSIMATRLNLGVSECKSWELNLLPSNTGILLSDPKLKKLMFKAQHHFARHHLLPIVKDQGSPPCLLAHG